VGDGGRHGDITASSRQRSLLTSGHGSIYAGMAEGGRDPDFESADVDNTFVDLDEMRHGLPESHPGRPQRQRPRGVRAGRQTRESKERRAREKAERRLRQDADLSCGGVAVSTDHQEAADGRAETTMRPIHKVARVAPMLLQPRRPLDRNAGRGAIILNLVLPPLTQPPHFWDHMDGQPMGYLCPSEFPTNQHQALAEARAKPHTTITLPRSPPRKYTFIIINTNKFYTMLTLFYHTTQFFHIQ